MDRELYCAGCGKHMATVRDARIRDGMVVYCRDCDGRNKRLLYGAMASTSRDVPDFMRGLFGGGKR